MFGDNTIIQEIEVIKVYEIGRLCLKLAGRDSRKHAVIVDILDDIYVLIDGQTRRRKCNIKHLEPLAKVIKIKKRAPHKDVVQALKKEGIKVVEKKAKKPKKITKEPIKKEKKTVKKKAKEKSKKEKTTKKRTSKK